MMRARVQKLQTLLRRVCRKPSRTQATSALIGALVLAFALGAYAFRGAIFVAQPAPAEASESASAQPAFRHPLTGAASVEAVDAPQVYAVMIDHAADAWPQAGLDQAFLVIEAPVEAGIPRLEAFFTGEQDLSKIGPVRSARPYFVDWANGLDAMFVHVGGSPAALDLIATSGTFDMNQFFNGATFWRATNRYAPHNVYTSSIRLREALEKAEAAGRAPKRLYESWEFADSVQDADAAEGKGLSVAFSSKAYRVDWEYLPEEGRYLRKQGGVVYKMEDGASVHADNVVAVVTDVRVVDAVGRRELRTLGEGKAFIAIGGEVIEGTWKKPSVSARLRFYDGDGEEIAMRPGTTWIEVVGDEKSITLE